MSKKFIFLFAPLDGVGHFNACIGTGQKLLERGHKVVFATPNSWKGKLTSFGFEEAYYQDPEFVNSIYKWGEILSTLPGGMSAPPMQKITTVNRPIYKQLVEDVKETSHKYAEVIARINPDLVIVDGLVQNPGIVNQGVPWVLSMSMNPMCIALDNLPPCYVGYPIKDGDRRVWEEDKAKIREIHRDIFEDLNSFVMANGGEDLKDTELLVWHKYSPYANIYMFPKELDYTEFRPNPPNWYHFEAFVRTENERFEIPDELKGLPGKLIYFSVGTIGCCDLVLMKRLMSILSKSPHRFIVSKGPKADQFELPPNMWGTVNVPQTKVIALVDLVITHGGNNTITESFYLGKPCLVLPLFVDQLDNAQRIQETGLGLRFDPYHVTEAELLKGIEQLLNNNELAQRMISISKRIQESNSQVRCAELLEKVAMEHGNVNHA